MTYFTKEIFAEQIKAMSNSVLKFTEIERFLRDRNISLSPADLEELKSILDNTPEINTPLVSQEEIAEILKITETLSNN